MLIIQIEFNNDMQFNGVALYADEMGDRWCNAEPENPKWGKQIWLVVVFQHEVLVNLLFFDTTTGGAKKKKKKCF